MLIPIIMLVLGASAVAGAFWQHKGNSFWAGFFLSIFIGPIASGIIGAVITPKEKQKLLNDPETRNILKLSAGGKQAVKVCPFCDRRVGEMDKFCSHCGHKLI